MSGTGSETESSPLEEAFCKTFPLKYCCRTHQNPEPRAQIPDPSHFLLLPVAAGECRTSRTNLIKTRSQLMNQYPDYCPCPLPASLRCSSGSLHLDGQGLQQEDGQPVGCTDSEASKNSHQNHMLVKFFTAFTGF